MTGFVGAGGGVEREFRQWERSLLEDLCGDLAVLLASAGAASSDPAILRLLPSAYPEDAEAAADFASFARPRLTRAKVESAQAILDDLAKPDPVSLGPDRIPLWLRGLTDLRLVLSERTGRNPDPVLGEVYDWLGWMLSDLLDALGEPPSSSAIAQQEE